MIKQGTPIMEIETKVLKNILISNKYPSMHNEIKKELNFRKQHNFNSNLSVNENNHIDFNNMVKTFKGE
tara:strand:+ start:558 stop:764 length:207 start_codon:yes stop_codon:yes gene_type:complete